ncbi:glutamate--cysteine ligase, chloroplastic-like [Quercus suber]|uniref:glutamate--cysteine ligase, chloroplastic-like n=1 Tax=Quercus suber TaxID=58331 RepID=UPI0032DF8A92
MMQRQSPPKLRHCLSVTNLRVFAVVGFVGTFSPVSIYRPKQPDFAGTAGTLPVKAVAGTMGIGFLAIGFQPKWEDKDTPLLPMARFGIARKFFSKRGSLALDVMHRTCTVQVNLDYSSEVDMVRKFRASLALQPVATALFANSPFTKEEPNGFLSMRSYTWTDIDERRTGMIPFVFNDSFGFERYIDYALDVPMVCVYRQKKYIDCAGMSFRGKEFTAAVKGESVRLTDRQGRLRLALEGVHHDLHLFPHCLHLGGDMWWSRIREGWHAHMLPLSACLGRGCPQVSPDSCLER